VSTPRAFRVVKGDGVQAPRLAIWLVHYQVDLRGLLLVNSESEDAAREMASAMQPEDLDLAALAVTKADVFAVEPESRDAAPRLTEVP